MNENIEQKNNELKPYFSRMGAWAFIGFENVAHFSGEFKFEKKKDFK